MMWIRRLQKKRFFHLPVAAYLAALLTVAVCVVAGRKDYHIEIRHTLREYADNQAVLAVRKSVIPDDLDSEPQIFDNSVGCLFLADKRGRIKCITKDQWDDLIRRDKTLPDVHYMAQRAWIINYSIEDQMDEAAEIATVYDAVMQQEDIPYLDQRLHLDYYYMTRLINETYSSVTMEGINIDANEDAVDKSFVDVYTGMVVASYGEKRVPTGYIMDIGHLTHPDSPTAKYAVKKLTQLAEIGDAEMGKRLIGQIKPAQE